MGTLVMVAVFETALLACVLYLVLRLRGQVDMLQAQARVLDGSYADAVAQMARLVDEAQELSESIADQLEDAVELISEPRTPKQPVPRQRRTKATATIPDIGGQADDTKGTKEPRKRATRRVADVAAVSNGAHLGESVETTQSDMKTARAKGMDPLGVALQRSLAEGRGGDW